MWKGIAVDAIDYELVRVGSPAGDELGSFTDAHVSFTPKWRLVAGYLMLASDRGDRLEIFSHGRLAASLQLHAGRVVFYPAPTKEWKDHGTSVRTAGIALVSASPTDDAEEGGIGLATDAPWAVSIVHGPAAEKIDARIDLLTSLQRVGGRRG
ncbi:hypothetical protein D7252_06820 [Microbacterium sp. CGR2]|nr:hypothetical protein D7252_06820 [Microbacterium sp. CGR2]